MGNAASEVLVTNVLHSETTPFQPDPSWTYYSQVSVACPQGWVNEPERRSVQSSQSSRSPSCGVAEVAVQPDLDHEADVDDDGEVEEPQADTDRQWGPWSLTQRELEVLQLLAEGATNSEISGRLFISPKTTKNHLAAIFQKLDVTNRTHALVRAVVMGLVSIE
jgi:DNA-binding CsgD family transcriptional regulator